MAGILPPIPIIGLPGAIAKNAPQAAEQQVSLLKLLHEGGFTGTTKEGEPADRVALAIIDHESGGDARVVNNQPCSAHGDHAVGLFQICCPMHMPVEEAKIPRRNIAKAHDLYVAAGNSFARDWAATYRPGAYRTAKDKTIRTGGIANPVDAVTGAVSAATDAALGPVDEIASALLSADTWFRVGKGLLGGTVIIVGLTAIAVIALKPLAKSAAGVATTANKGVNAASKVAKLAAK